MTLSNWVELTVLAATVFGMGFSLLKTTKKVADLDGFALEEPGKKSTGSRGGTVIGGN